MEGYGESVLQRYAGGIVRAVSVNLDIGNIACGRGNKTDLFGDPGDAVFFRFPVGALHRHITDDAVLARKSDIHITCAVGERQCDLN